METDNIFAIYDEKQREKLKAEAAQRAEWGMIQRKRYEGHIVIATHINTGIDFFTCEIPECDYIISNPPYSCKSEVIQRLFEIGKPFAMLVGVVGLFESQKRFDIFKNNDFEILYMNRRIAYFKNYEEQKPSLNPPFSSVYICSKMLPKQIIFEEISKAS